MGGETGFLLATAAVPIALIVFGQAEVSPSAISSYPNALVASTNHSEEDARSSVLNDYLMNGLTPSDEFHIVEEAIAECMHLRGWEYTPILLRSTATEEPSTLVALGEYRREYGYGLATIELLLQQTPPAPEDPNEAYASGLSPAGQERYYLDREGTLIGEPTPEARENSCRGIAEAGVHDTMPFFQLDVGALVDEVDADREVQAALENWQTCMAAAGYRFDTPDAARYAIFQRMSGGTTDLEELADEERAVASADYACALDTLYPARARVESRIVARLEQDQAVQLSEI